MVQQGGQLPSWWQHSSWGSTNHHAWGHPGTYKSSCLRSPRWSSAKQIAAVLPGIYKSCVRSEPGSSVCLHLNSTTKSQIKWKWAMLSTWHSQLNWPHSLITASGASWGNTACMFNGCIIDSKTCWPVNSANEPWLTTSYLLSKPLPSWESYKSQYTWWCVFLCLGFNTSWLVLPFLNWRVHAIWHCVILYWLLSALWLVATALPAKGWRTCPILSTHIACRWAAAN